MADPTTSSVLADASRGKLTQQEMTAWIQIAGPKASDVQRVLNTAKLKQPKTNLGWLVKNGQIMYLPGVLGSNAPGTPQEAPMIPSLGNLGKLDIAGGADWKHLLLRIAEFIIGFGLVGLGIWSVVRKTDTYKTAEKAVITTAAVVPK